MPVRGQIVAGALKNSKTSVTFSLAPRLQILLAAFLGLTIGSALGYWFSRLF